MRSTRGESMNRCTVERDGFKVIIEDGGSDIDAALLAITDCLRGLSFSIKNLIQDTDEA